jgi:hypothetical protein
VPALNRKPGIFSLVAGNSKNMSKAMRVKDEKERPSVQASIL